MAFNVFFKNKKIKKNNISFFNKFSLNQKILIYFVIQIIIVILAINVFSKRVVVDNIINMEKVKDSQKLYSIVNAIDNELNTVQKFSKDYSNWNKTYEYVEYKIKELEKDYCEAFEKENFDSINMMNLGINAIIILDNDGKILYESLYSEDELGSYEISKEIKDISLKEEILNSITEFSSKNGIIKTENGIYFVSMNPILNNNGSGKKAGILLMGKEISKIKLEETTPEFYIEESVNSLPVKNENTIEQSNIETKNLGEVKNNIELVPNYIKSIESRLYIKDFTESEYINIKLEPELKMVDTIKITRVLFLGILSLYILIIIFTWNFLNNSFMHKINNIIKSISKLNKYNLEYQYKELDIQDELVIVEKQIDTLVNELNNHYDEIIVKSNTDELTGLYNRVGFNKEIENYNKESKNKDLKSAVLFLDIDKFKNINDIYGHKIGDSILRELANRISINSIPNSVLSRTSGDEFVIFIKEYKDKEDVIDFASNLVKVMNEPFKLGGYSIKATVSIGISFYPEGCNNMNDLVIQGDIAMYNVKKNGRNNYAEYNSGMKKIISGIAITEAIKYKEMFLVYQPQINPINNCIEGVESLIRWNSKILGFVPPNEFIKIAEETGTIHDLGNFIIEEVFNQINIWERMKFSIPKVSINISPIQLMDKYFYDYVESMLEKYSISTEKIVFEITENFAIEDQKVIVDNLYKIHEAGINIYLDDFGKGYSSLGYLEKLPISGVKIDKKFIDYICQNDKIVKMIFTLAQSLNLKVVAEGVEYNEQKEKLTQMGECVIQGYLYSKPLTVNELESKYIN